MTGTTAKQLLKSLHITGVAIVMGSLLTLAVQAFLIPASAPGPDTLLLDLSLYRTFNLLVTYSFYGVLLTGLVFSLFTSWRFFRYYWIMLKWGLAILLFGVVWIWLGPAINGAAALADGGLYSAFWLDSYREVAVQRCWFSLGVVLTMVLITYISVRKPWGKRELKKRISRKIILWGWGVTLLGLVITALAGYTNLQTYRKISIQDSDLTTLANGSYNGEVTFGGYTYRVEVEVQEHKISDVRIVDNRTSSYARYAEGVIPRILQQQNANVDAITGATTTSKCLLKAVENALKGPGSELHP